MTFEERLDAMELEIRKPIFRKNRGRANEVNYWVFDYPPEKELEVRARIERMQQKNVTGKKTRHTARKQDGAYCTRHDYKIPGGKQEVRCHYIVTMQSIGGSIQRTIHTTRRNR